MKAKCRLCENDRELLESHIIPSFVFRWLKESSGTGFIRFGKSPNLRVQDGLKDYFLCGDCEGRFDVWETQFANTIFHPCNEGKSVSLPYDDWMLKFAVSVSWRVLVLANDKTNLTHFPESLREKAYRAISVWKEFLLGQISHPAKFEQHMLPLGSVKSFNNLEVPPNINRYLLRSCDMDVVRGGDTVAYVYSKMGKILLLGFIAMPRPDRWKGTKIHVRRGLLGTRKYVLPDKFAEYLFGRARKVQELQSSISPEQKKKIDLSYRRDKDKEISSDSFKALKDDVDLFGEEEVFKE